MEAKLASGPGPEVELATLFSDLVRVETELWDRVDRRLRNDHGLPLSWFEPMQVMDQMPDCRVADIAQALSITVGGTSKLVDRIEQAGFCSRAPNPGDARSSVVTLTRKGRRVFVDARGSFDEELEVTLGAALPAPKLASLASNIHIARLQLVDRRGSA